MSEKLERITTFYPAFDRRNKNPKKDYGIHSVQCFMSLKGKKGVVDFNFSTGMLLTSTMQEYIKAGRAKYEMLSFGEWYLNKPMGFNVGYHAKKKQWKGQKLHHPTKMIVNNKKKGLDKYGFKKIGTRPPKCKWIGVPCYCDGSAIRAEDYLKVLIEKGSEPIWKMLESEYKNLI